MTARVQDLRSARRPVFAALLAAFIGVVGVSGAYATTPNLPPGVAHARAAIAKYSALKTNFPPPGPPLKGVKKALAGKTVWYIPLFLSAPIFGVGVHELKYTFGLAGATVQVCDARFNPSAADACFNQAINAKAAGIITDSFDDSFDPQGFASAVNAGIPVLVADNLTLTGLPQSPLLVNLTGNQFLTGRLEADWVIADSHGKANVLYTQQVSNLGNAVAADATREFRVHCPGCKVTVVRISAAAQQNIPSTVSTALIADPSINYVVCPFDLPSGAAVLQGANQVSGRHFTFVCGGGDPSGLERISAGTQGADIGVDPVENVWIDTDAMLRIITGEKRARYSITASVRVFTAKNVPANPSSLVAWESGRWYSNDGYKKMYRSLWGV